MAGETFHYDRMGKKKKKKKHQVEKAKHKIDSFLMDKRKVFITSQVTIYVHQCVCVCEREREEERERERKRERERESVCLSVG